MNQSSKSLSLNPKPGATHWITLVNNLMGHMLDPSLGTSIITLGFGDFMNQLAMVRILL
jgi:hypothetical protein